MGEWVAMGTWRQGAIMRVAAHPSNVHWTLWLYGATRAAQQGVWRCANDGMRRRLPQGAGARAPGLRAAAEGSGLAVCARRDRLLEVLKPCRGGRCNRWRG